jgi:hypothetical protein
MIGYMDVIHVDEKPATVQLADFLVSFGKPGVRRVAKSV